MKHVKDCYYFPHDSNARSDPKIMALIQKYGIEGYGRWWVLVEMLSEQKDYKMKHSQWVTNALAMAMLCQPNGAEEFVNDCINEFELILSDGEYFWSNSLIERMKIKEEKRRKKSEAGKKGAETRWHDGEEWQSHGTANGNAIADQKQTNGKNGKGKESKGKENKNNTVQYTDDFEEFWRLYPRKVKKPDAFKRWNARLKEGHTNLEMVNALKEYLKEIRENGTEKKFIKHPSTFIGPSKDFKDYIKTEEEKPKKKVLGVKSYQEAVKEEEERRAIK